MRLVPPLVALSLALFVCACASRAEDGVETPQARDQQPSEEKSELEMEIDAAEVIRDPENRQQPWKDGKVRLDSVYGDGRRHGAHPIPQPSPRSQMLFIVLTGTFLMMQILLVQWKQKNPKSFHAVTLGGLWIIPIMVSIFLRNIWFSLSWLAFTLVTGYFMSLARHRPLGNKTPQKVYRWFDLVHRVCYMFGMTGYFLVMAELLGVRYMIGINSKANAYFTLFGLTVLCYSLYFGVLGRDCAEVCAERMSNTIGYVKYTVAPPNLCALCGEELRPSPLLNPDPSQIENIFTLDCKHEFHETCIRGWSLVGKKDTCPFCSEKVDVKSIVGTSPWDKQSVLWLQLLDLVRYMVVWNPIIFIFIRIAFSVLDLITPLDNPQ